MLDAVARPWPVRPRPVPSRELKQLIANGRGCQDTVELDAEAVRMDETFERLVTPKIVKVAPSPGTRWRLAR